ncbi:MAG TPA: MFS transporter [Chromatiales bacterium]|nr:MFS transporter [Chromatiales bacterium]
MTNIPDQVPEQVNDQPDAKLTDRLLLGAGVLLFAIGQSLNFLIVAPMARNVGLSEQQFGLAFTIASLPLIFSAPFWGRRSDRIGRKPVYILGLAGSGIGTALLGVSLQLGLDGVLGVFGVLVCITAARSLYGLTSSAIYPAAAAYMADITSFRNRARGMALIGSSNSFGSILGPVLAATLSFAGALVPMYAAATLSICGAVIAVFVLREPATHATRQRKKSELKFWDPRLRPFLILWGAFFLVFVSLNLLTAFYIQDRFGITDEKAVIRTASLVLISMAGVITLVQGVFLQIWRVPPRILLRLCAPAFTAGLLVMGFATSTRMLMGGYALLGLSFAFATPGINGSASLAVEPHEQGAAAGFLSASNTAGAILAPIVGTSIYQIAPNAPYLIGAGLFFFISLYALTIKVAQPARHPL